MSQTSTQPPESLKLVLGRLSQQATLSSAETEQVFEPIMRGEAEPVQVAALLTLLSTRPPTVNELLGVATVMRRHLTAIPAPENVIDTCGTGGIGSRTFNVSTAAAIVAAAAGVPVCKHGNRGFTSVSGSSDVLEHLGVNIHAPVDVQARCLREANICFAYAADHHPSMRHVARLRELLGFSTIFNLMGPLTNPAGAQRQLVGAPTRALAETLLRVLVQLGGKRIMAVSGSDGQGGRMCELSTCGPNEILLYDGDELKTFTLTAPELGMAAAELPALLVGDAAESAATIRAVFAGEAGPARDMVVLNSGAALWVGGAVENVSQSVQAASAAIDSGKAAATLDLLAALSNGRR